MAQPIEAMERVSHGIRRGRRLLSRTVEQLLYVVAGLIGGTGVCLIVDGHRTDRRRRRRPDLAERLLPYRRGIADEAEAWLTQQR